MPAVGVHGTRITWSVKPSAISRDPSVDDLSTTISSSAKSSARRQVPSKAERL
jgi:hypothetical protein